jgi:hypothetical protein
VLLIAKGFFPLSICENIWMCRLALKLQVSFSFSNEIKSEDILPTMVVQYLDFHLQFQLDVILTTTFDLWMSRGQHDTFVFVVKNLFANWNPQFVTITFLRPMTLLGMVWQGN